MTGPAGPLHVVVPDDIDDPALCSGGNVYDRRLYRALSADGWDVRQLRVPGAYPHPDGYADPGAGSHGWLPQ